MKLVTIGWIRHNEERADKRYSLRFIWHVHLLNNYTIYLVFCTENEINMYLKKM